MKKLEDLENEGWELDTKEREKIAISKRAIEMNKTANKIADSIITLTSAANSMQKASTEENIKIGLMLVSKIEALKDALSQQSSQKWIFSVDRNSKGFISKVTAKRE